MNISGYSSAVLSGQTQDDAPSSMFSCPESGSQEREEKKKKMSCPLRRLTIVSLTFLGNWREIGASLDNRVGAGNYKNILGENTDILSQKHPGQDINTVQNLIYIRKPI